MKKISLLVVLFAVIFNKGFAQDCGCDHVISSDMNYFNAEGVLPGDVICITAGIRSALKIKNVHGSTSNPIIIKNCGGEVIIEGEPAAHTLVIGNSYFFNLTGSGDADVEFGIHINGGSEVGLLINDLSHHFEVDQVEIGNVHGVGLQVFDEPRCDLSANEGVFLLKSIELNHLNVHHCETGIQIGHPNYVIGQYNEFCDVLYPYSVEEVVISNSSVVSISPGNGIELYLKQGVLKNNYIDQITANGVAIGRGGQVNLIANKISNTDLYGLTWMGDGKLDVSNSIFYKNGATGAGAAQLSCYTALGDAYTNIFNFQHNTVLASAAFNVEIENASSISALSKIQNNIFCEPTDLLLSDELYSPYINVGASALLHIDHNSYSPSISEQVFVNVAEENFQLTHESPGINVGVLTGIPLDRINQLRNLGGAPDAGAFEYVPEPIAYFDKIPLNGLYVDDFKNILGNPAAEIALLEFAKENGFNYLLLYNLAYIHEHTFDLTIPSEAIVLANFIERAKKNYGIVQVGAVGEKDASFNKISTFNSFYGDNWFRKFDVLNLEFEFWTSPGSAVFEYYCETYLSPGGYPCTNAGAYSFYLDELALIDARAHGMGIISEIYLGYMSDPQAIELAETTDRILLHHYRTSDVYGDGTSIYNYHTNRIRAIALSDRMPAVMPIFSSRAYHMGPWLMSHEIDEAMNTWMYGLMGYTFDDAPGVSDLKISGCQWYRYTSFLDLGIFGMMAPEETDSEEEEMYRIVTNPADETLTIVSLEDVETLNLSYEIYSLQGDLVAKSATQNAIDLTGLSSGMYVLNVLDREVPVYATKFVHH
jgi:hypothetical protein